MTHVQHQLQLMGLDLPLAVVRLQGTERLGGVYRYEIECEGPGLVPDLGTRACLRIGERLVWGQISAARQAWARGVPRLHLVLEPRLAALRGQRLNQVFLNQSSVQTVQQVLADGGLSPQWQDWQTQAAYPAYTQRTALEQDALSFVLWLLEFEGIGLRFAHTEAGERLVFFDEMGGFDRSAPYMDGLRLAPRAGLIPESEPETLTHAQMQGHSRPGAVRLTDYDPLQAGLNLLIEEGDGDFTEHLHGEHYTSREHGEQLARVRREAQACREQTLAAAGPLVHLQAGQLIQVDGDPVQGLWLVTRMALNSHRDGSLQVSLEASPGEQMWRPERVTIRPKAQGISQAKIHQGVPVAQLDETGRYRVRYPWQDDPQSELIRLAQPYAGPEYGLHAPLKDNTEVWLTHANGDPDRPLILGAAHHGQEPDVVTAKDASRNVVRTRSGNKLRLEDRQGQEHIKLHTPYGNSQLTLGHAMDHDKAQRGQGVELRTERWGAIRSANALLVTTGIGSPRSGGEAQRSAGSAEVRSTLDSLESFSGNRSKAAGQVGADEHRGLVGAKDVNKELGKTAREAAGASKANQVHWAQAGHALGAPTILLATSGHLSAWSIASQDWLAGSKLQIAVKDASRVHVEQGGRKAFVSDGNAETTVSKGKLHLKVQGALVLQAGELSLKAGGSSLLLDAGGHAGFKSAGSTVIQTSTHTAKAGAVMVQGGSAAKAPAALTAQAMQRTPNWLELKRLDDMDLSPLPAQVSATFTNGEQRAGQLDKNGFIRFDDVPAGLAQIEYRDPEPETLRADHALAKLVDGLDQLMGSA